ARAGLHPADDRAGEARRLCDELARPSPPDPGDPCVEQGDPLARREAGRELRQAGLERGHHQEGDDRDSSPPARRGPRCPPRPPGPRRAPPGSAGGRGRPGAGARAGRNVRGLPPGSPVGRGNRSGRRLERSQELAHKPANRSPGGSAAFARKKPLAILTAASWPPSKPNSESPATASGSPVRTAI